MNPVVETTSGKLAGRVHDGVARFLGIPYARAPVGDRRFRPPEPPETWTGVREAHAFGGSAPQVEFDVGALPGASVGPQSEDCLYLNAWTPASDDGRRPVLIWIHGGGFTVGSGSQGRYDPTGLVARGNVVVVTINYRLGALGFLHVGAPANLGLLDQIEALAWVRDNAAALGGDPENVTIFGESSGGRSVAALLGTPAARGLFQRAIAQSGAASHFHDEASARAVADEFLREIGIARGSMQALREVPIATLLEAQGRVVARRVGTPGWLPFQPVIDGIVLQEPPLDAIRTGLSRDVPLLVGSNRDEWKLFAAMDPRLRRLDEAGLLARMTERVPDRDPERARALIEGYRRSGESRVGTTPLDLFCAIETDRVYRIPALQLADAQRKAGADVHTYHFTRPAAPLDFSLGACHAAELPFVFGNVRSDAGRAFAGSGPDVELLEARMVDAWARFAHTGAPSARALPEWLAYTTERRETMILGAKCELALDPDPVTRRLWDAAR